MCKVTCFVHLSSQRKRKKSLTMLEKRSKYCSIFSKESVVTKLFPCKETIKVYVIRKIIGEKYRIASSY